MKTFKDIDEFIAETFPFEYDKIVTQRSTAIEKSIKNIDTSFDQELEKIIKGENGKKKEKA